MRDSVRMAVKIGWVQSVDPLWLQFVDVDVDWEEEVFAVLREQKRLRRGIATAYDYVKATL